MAKMRSAKVINIEQLHLDLDNYRTMHQKDEISAINSMISIKPERFWALMDSLIEDSYMATENIILIESNDKLIVKEGNRRIAALKIIHGFISGIQPPRSIELKISQLPSSWKDENSTVPCLIYKESESENIKKIISRIHAKGEKAGRDNWTTVARARYNRDEKGETELGLDLLEKYIKSGKNHTAEQAERWSGDYPLTVLDEAIHKIFPHLKYDSAKRLIDSYPQKNKLVIDSIVHDIGLENLSFKDIRKNEKFFGSYYGVEEILQHQNSAPAAGSASINQPNSDQEPYQNPSRSPLPQNSHSTNNSTSNEPNVDSKQKLKPKAAPLYDQKSVSRILRSFAIRGDNREKVSALYQELKKLKIDTHPHAFCFLLRSIFEISAKVYCEEKKISITDKNRKDKKLSDLLKEIYDVLTNNSNDKEMVKKYHGAITEILKPDGLLSVTSMNQLVHNPKFSISPTDICILFGNIFPLLEEINR